MTDHISTCCHARTITRHADEGTGHYVCTDCGEACDARLACPECGEPMWLRGRIVDVGFLRSCKNGHREIVEAT